MDFESKILSREISQLLWEREQTLGTAESCTGGRIAEAIIAIPGASKYFKGGIVSYVDEVKENLLGVNHDVIEEQTAVCEEVARQMVVGACRSLNTDFAIAAILSLASRLAVLLLIFLSSSSEDLLDVNLRLIFLTNKTM